jgi:hypothetical protein
VNGFFSVAGASLASIGALWLGFRWTIAAGAALYALAGLLFPRVGDGNGRNRVHEGLPPWSIREKIESG